MYNRPLAGICLATTLFVCAANGAPAAPEESPPPADGELVIDGYTDMIVLDAGDEIEIIGEGFHADGNTSLVLYSAPTTVDELVADAEGVVTATVTVPNVGGEHTLVLIGNDPEGDALVLSVAVTIRGNPAGTLPATGAGIGVLLAVAVALVIAGAAIVRGTRIRQRA
jgi:hypothetical protein